MKNFRKVLALVLVVATLFSFAAMAGAKSLADYKDADKISTENYAVAVEVLSALEILNGYEDETFKPTNTISREEMAKMIAVLSNAGDDVSALYAAANSFADVEEARWSASYIAYCAQTGIVAGRTADTFDPYGKVTGLETAKMLLVTMGFDAAEQGYVGANWKINVLRDAKNFGLMDGFAAGYNVDVAITREEAANMMLNALKAQTVVGLLSENIVKITNALYDALPILTLKDAEHKGFKLMYGNVIVAPITLAEALYEGRLDVESVIDCYGRPGTIWTLTNKKGTEILSGKFIADAMFASATVAMDIATVCKEELKLGYDVVTYVDGAKAPAVDTAAEAAALTGNGVLTEIYVNDATDEIRVIIINTFFGKVTATTKAANTFVVDGKCFSNKAYGFAEGDYILYWLCADGLHTAKEATPVAATVSRVEKHADIEDSLFIADGVTYTYHKNFPILNVPDVDKKFNIYVDEYGYVIAVLPYVAETEYFYAYVVEGTGCFGDVKHYANGSYGYTATKDMVDFTAAYNKDVAVDAKLYALSLEPTLEDIIHGMQLADKAGKLVKYTIDSEGRASLEACASNYASMKKNGDVVCADGTVAYGNDDTKYLVRTWDYAAKDYVYTAYTQDTLPYAYENIGAVQVFTKTVGVKDVTVATYVFIDALYAKVASHAFVLDYAKSVSDTMFKGQIGAYDAYEAIIDGAEGYLLVTGEEALPEGTMVEGELQVIGLYDDGKPVYANVGAVKADLVGETIEYIAGELVYDGKSVDPADDIFVCVITEDGAVILESVEELNDYVETIHGFAHGTAHNTEDCNAFVFGEAWFYGNPTSELYVVVNDSFA